MPEGDSIARIADRLRPVLVGRPVVRVEVARGTRRPPAPGTEIIAVEAIGKHLFVRFADRRALHTHLRMTGRWDLYPSGERWRRPRHLARAVVEVEGWTAVCFSAPVAEMVDDDGSRVAHLGPDLSVPGVDLEAVVARSSSIPDPGTPIDEVLLDQRVAAGIGNVYKSDVLWLCRQDPFAPVETVTVERRRALYEAAARLLQANRSGGPRTTVPGPPGSLAVYGRARRACRRCGSPIRSARRGALARTTYWCPTCQPPRGEDSRSGVDP